MPNTADWQDYVTTIATATAALGAVAAAIIAARAYRRQTFDRHREQASKVAAWIEEKYLTKAPHAGPVGESLRVRNASTQPIFNVVALVREGPPAGQGLTTRSFLTLPPGADEQDDVSVAVRTGSRSASLYVVLSFVDSAGVRWQRDGNTGRLSKQRLLT